MFKNIGWLEITIIAVLLLVLFGGKLLPKVGKNVGKSKKELTDATGELKDAIKKE